MNTKEPLGFIDWREYFYNIEVTENLIRKSIIEVMEEIKFYPDSIQKRKVAMMEETIVQQISPNKRINNGKNYEKAVYSTMNNAGYKPIRTQPPDRGIDIIGEYKGITIYAQAKDWQSKVTAAKIQQLEGVLVNKHQSIGVMVSKSGYTKDAVDYARASTMKILLTDLDTVIDSISQAIEQMQLQSQSRIEVTGQSAEITQITEENLRKVTIKNAERVVIYN
jgi:restriction endonuclease Mrr